MIYSVASPECSSLPFLLSGLFSDMASFSCTHMLLVLVFFLIGYTTAYPTNDYDVIVVGGGPAGLSATSGLARVRRKVLMLDSGEYRNGATRHMHDVIGNDGR
jgi:hypothetical protein